MTLEEQLEKYFDLTEVKCENLNTPANDVISVNTPTARFALKLYNTGRTAAEVQWEIDLTNYLIRNGMQVVAPVPGRNGHVEAFNVEGQDRVAVLFEWASGDKPKPDLSTYVLLGKAAAQMHKIADTFTSPLSREEYNATVLIDEQIERMKSPLIEVDRLKQTVDLGERLKKIMANPALDYGICHMDLTLDNVHREGDTMTVFDFDSAGLCWRAMEPHGVLRASEDRFKAWLEGYRSVRPFSQDDEKAVTAFGIIGDVRNVVWKLGFAGSSRGKPLLQTSELPGVVDEWLEWERKYIL